MNDALSRSRSRTWALALLFFGLSVAVYATAIVFTGRLAEIERANVVAAAMTLDLVVVVPLAFYALVVRRLGWPWIAVIPLFAFGAVTASWLIPTQHHRTLHVLEWLALPFEVALVVWIALRAVRAMRSARHNPPADPLEQVHRAAFDFVRHERIASILAMELAAFYYALFSWRAKPHVPEGTTPITHHERSNHAVIVIAFLFLLLVEGLAVHILLLKWSVIAAWVFTIGTMYGALWMIADYRATVLRPIVMGDASLLIRAGLRWTGEIQRARIAGVRRVMPDSGNECQSIAFLVTPTHWITFAEPMIMRGAYGFRCEVRAVGLEPDDPATLEPLESASIVFRTDLPREGRRTFGDGSRTLLASPECSCCRCGSVLLRIRLLTKRPLKPPDSATAKASTKGASRCPGS